MLSSGSKGKKYPQNGCVKLRREADPKKIDSNNCPYTIKMLDYHKIDQWPLVKSGLLTIAEMREIIDRYFKEDSWNGGAFDKFRLSKSDWDSLSDSKIVAMPAGDPNLKELLKRRKKGQLMFNQQEFCS